MGQLTSRVSSSSSSQNSSPRRPVASPSSSPSPSPSSSSSSPSPSSTSNRIAASSLTPISSASVPSSSLFSSSSVRRRRSSTFTNSTLPPTRRRRLRQLWNRHHSNEESASHDEANLISDTVQEEHTWNAPSGARNVSDSNSPHSLHSEMLNEMDDIASDLFSTHPPESSNALEPSRQPSRFTPFRFNSNRHNHHYQHYQNASHRNQNRPNRPGSSSRPRRPSNSSGLLSDSDSLTFEHQTEMLARLLEVAATSTLSTLVGPSIPNGRRFDNISRTFNNPPFPDSVENTASPSGSADTHNNINNHNSNVPSQNNVSQSSRNQTDSSTLGNDSTFSDFLEGLHNGLLTSELSRNMNDSGANSESMTFFRAFRFDNENSATASNLFSNSSANHHHARDNDLSLNNFSLSASSSAGTASIAASIIMDRSSTSHPETDPTNTGSGTNTNAMNISEDRERLVPVMIVGVRSVQQSSDVSDPFANYSDNDDDTDEANLITNQRSARNRSSTADAPFMPSSLFFHPSILNSSDESLDRPQRQPSLRSSSHSLQSSHQSPQQRQQQQQQQQEQQQQQQQEQQQQEQQNQQHAQQRQESQNPRDRNSSPPPRSWVIFVMGNTFAENHPLLRAPSLMSENPTYEDLLHLQELLGQVKPPVTTKDELTKHEEQLFEVKLPTETLTPVSSSANTVCAAPHKVSTSCVNTTLKRPSSATEAATEAATGVATGNTKDTETSSAKLKPKYQYFTNITKLDRCQICLAEYEDEEIIRKLPSCNHFYHRKCIDTWLLNGRNNCPLCRSKGIDSSDKVNENEKCASASPFSASMPHGMF